MRQTIFSTPKPITSLALGGAVAVAMFALPVRAQQPGQTPPVTVTGPAAPAPAATAPMPMPATMAPPQAGAAAAPVASAPPVTASQAAGPPAGSPPGTPAVAPTPAVATATPTPPSTAPEDTNPFSSVKPIDNAALKQQLPVLEQRLRLMEDKVSTIQQTQLAIPEGALGGGGGGVARAPGQPMSPEEVELETATFVACVNGQALFRDSDQKPFFVNAREANQNESIRRIGGCSQGSKVK